MSSSGGGGQEEHGVTFLLTYVDVLIDVAFSQMPRPSLSIVTVIDND